MSNGFGISFFANFKPAIPAISPTTQFSTLTVGDTGGTFTITGGKLVEVSAPAAPAAPGIGVNSVTEITSITPTGSSALVNATSYLPDTTESDSPTVTDDGGSTDGFSALKLPAVGNSLWG